MAFGKKKTDINLLPVQQELRCSVDRVTELMEEARAIADAVASQVYQNREHVKERICEEIEDLKKDASRFEGEDFFAVEYFKHSTANHLLQTPESCRTIVGSFLTYIEVNIGRCFAYGKTGTSVDRWTREMMLLATQHALIMRSYCAVMYSAGSATESPAECIFEMYLELQQMGYTLIRRKYEDEVIIFQLDMVSRQDKINSSMRMISAVMALIALLSLAATVAAFCSSQTQADADRYIQRVGEQADAIELRLDMIEEQSGGKEDR